MNDYFLTPFSLNWGEDSMNMTPFATGFSIIDDEEEFAERMKVDEFYTFFSGRGYDEKNIFK